MTPDQMRHHARYSCKGDSRIVQDWDVFDGDHRLAQSWERCAEICERLDALIAATKVRTVEVISMDQLIGGADAESE